MLVVQRFDSDLKLTLSRYLSPASGCTLARHGDTEKQPGRPAASYGPRTGRLIHSRQLSGSARSRQTKGRYIISTSTRIITHLYITQPKFKPASGKPVIERSASTSDIRSAFLYLLFRSLCILTHTEIERAIEASMTSAASRSHHNTIDVDGTAASSSTASTNTTHSAQTTTTRQKRPSSEFSEPDSFPQKRTKRLSDSSIDLSRQ